MDAPHLPPFQEPLGAGCEPHAPLVMGLVQRALAADDIPGAVLPALDALVTYTAAAGSAYFQVGGAMFRARSASGVMPQGPAMEAILAHGLPADAPLMQALERATAPLFFDDVTLFDETAGFSELGVVSLAAAPVRHRDRSLLGAFLMHTFERHVWREGERDLFSAVGGTLAALAARFVAEEQALAAEVDALKALGVVVESRDSEVKGHIDRVTALAERVGRAMNLGAEALSAVRRGAYLHDLGKVSTPDAILHKRGALSPEERRVMQQHAEAGHHVAQQLAFLPQATLDTILYHHERWDGQGYPYGLKEAAIPLTARVFAVCDVYDALTSARPYKPAWSHDDAVAEIQAQSGKQFDPAVVTAFMSIFKL